ncbi:ribosome-inactivating family protein [Wolbachia pipientis]|nr:ribosome-inactivating family protein [Wolbachia pipientis]
MSKIRFILAIILSFSILSNGLLAEEMHSVPSELIRKKRDIPTPTIRLEDLFGNDHRYTEFINQLRNLFARRDNGNINYVGPSNNIPVIRGDGGGRRVELVGSDQVGSVQLVFRNSDLYIIGFIRDGVFYRMRDGNLNEGITVDIPSQNIRDMPPVTNYDIPHENIGHDPDDLIRPLIRYAERRNLNRSDPQRLDENSPIPTETRASIFRFALILSEAIRFLPVQREVQNALNSYRAVNTNANLFAVGGLRYPDYVLGLAVYNLSWLIVNWQKLTKLIDTINNYFSAQIYEGRETITISESDMSLILGLAHSCINSNQPGPSGRSPRDTESHSPDKCYLGDIGREGIMTGNSYWDIDSAPILISEILNTHIDYGASAHAG